MLVTLQVSSVSTTNWKRKRKGIHILVRSYDSQNQPSGGLQPNTLYHKRWESQSKGTDLSSTDETNPFVKTRKTDIYENAEV